MSKFKLGRIRRLTLSKVVKTSVYKRILRFQGVNQYGALDLTADGDTAQPNLPGFFWVQNTLGTDSGATSDAALPLHVFLLNSTANTYNCNTVTAGNLGKSAGLKQLRINRATGACSFTLINGQQSTGGSNVTSGDQWNLEWQSDNITNTIPATRKICTQWMDIRLMLHGCTRQVSVFDVMLVRFKEDYLDPNVTPTITQEVENRNAFWQGMVKNLITNPIIPHGTAIMDKNKIQVLRTYRVQIDPSTTDDRDANPGHKVLKIFYPFGVCNDYAEYSDQHNVGNDPANTGVNSVGWVPQFDANADFQDNPKPRARVYLLIKCLNAATAGEYTVQDRRYTPSYDLVVRKKEAFNAM